jgi:hypothetical protein
MTKKKKKDKRPSLPRANPQIAISSIRPMKIFGPRYYLQHAHDYPIFGCWVMKGWKKEGITPVVVARKQAPDLVLFAVCMVDLYCLGVKNAFSDTGVSLAHFWRELPTMCIGTPEKCSVELAHEIIYGGIEYASHFGFQPHHDFAAQMCDKVLDPPEAHPHENKVKFGKNGKPFFVAGPYDDESRIRSVIDTLARTAGSGNFNYLVDLDSSDFYEE